MHIPRSLPKRAVFTDPAGQKIGLETYFVYVNCEGIDDLYETYRSRGVQFTQPLANKPWGQREFGVVTPEGHRIMFGQTI